MLQRAFCDGPVIILGVGAIPMLLFTTGTPAAMILEDFYETEGSIRYSVFYPIQFIKYSAAPTVPLDYAIDI